MAESISFDRVGYTYNDKTPFAQRALHDVTFSVPMHQVTAIIGHTGSGKSTLLRHLNVLLRPTEGEVTILEEKVTAQSSHASLKGLRRRVGVVFQFPEAQLFEETVLKDVMFGPLNFGVEEAEAEAIAKEKLGLVGIGPELYERSPFELSGGQMRRVAIAGVLALKPEVLVLDEPTAGLDPLGHQEMMAMFMDLKAKENLTLIMVTHQMDDVADYADYVIVLEAGTIAKRGTTHEVFSDIEWLEARQLGVPKAAAFYAELDIAEADSADLPLTVSDLADRILQASKGGDHHDE